MKSKPLAIAAVVAATGFVALFFYVQQLRAEIGGGAPVKVVVALQDIALGTALRSDMLGVHEMPEAFVEDRHVLASDVNRIIGSRVSSSLHANETVLWTDLAVSNEQRRDLSGLVSNGMRAVAIQAGVNSGFGGLLRPGDRVDVLLNFKRRDVGPITAPILQNVIVLAAGTDTGGFVNNVDDDSSAVPVNQVVLSTTLQQSQLLVLAQERGLLTLVLRNPHDVAVVDALPETSEKDLLNAAETSSAPPIQDLGSSSQEVAGAAE